MKVTEKIRLLYKNRSSTEDGLFWFNCDFYRLLQYCALKITVHNEQIFTLPHITMKKNAENIITYLHQQINAITQQGPVQATLTDDRATSSTMLSKQSGKFGIRQLRNIYTIKIHGLVKIYV